MRISLDCRAMTAAPHSGIARQNRAMLGALRENTLHEVFPLSWAPEAHADRQWATCPRRPAPIDGLHRPGQRWHFEARFLPWALSRHQVDLHVATLNMGLPLQLAGRRPRGTRWVLQLHDVFQITQHNRHRSRLREALYRSIDRASIAYGARVADAIWVPSRYTAQCVQQLWPGVASKVGLLPNAVPVAQWQVPCPRPTQAPALYWLAVGSREPRKNLARLVRAWTLLRSAQPQTPALVILGQRSDVPEAGPEVTFVHGLSDPQVAAWYQHADRLWHPAWAEGFGLPVIEAAACGTPCASALGSALDEVTPPGSPRFDPFSVEAIRHCMAQALLGSRAPSESPEALRAWAGQFDLPAYTHRLHQLLAQLP